mmetsp:Transcript_1728/g.2400  ORF Transcript_1728/g.2400 Transcript_1728/m.2400 type:complete len:114 (+) Transcript_1728:283-624(+)
MLPLLNNFPSLLSSESSKGISTALTGGFLASRGVRMPTFSGPSLTSIRVGIVSFALDELENESVFVYPWSLSFVYFQSTLRLDTYGMVRYESNSTSCCLESTLMDGSNIKINM